MSNNPLSSNPNDDESALTDEDLDGVVGGTGTATPCPLHAGQYIPHYVEDANGILQSCNGGATTTRTGGTRSGDFAG